jgi:hypothetical protein
MEYVLRGLDKEGNIRFYTGGAGDRWLTPVVEHAFPLSKERAQRRAIEFNKMEGIHGYWFIIQRVDVVS